MSYGFKMSREAVAKSIQEGKLIIPRDMLGDFVGLLQFLSLWMICGFTLRHANSDFSTRMILAFIATGMLFFYAIYCLLRERDLTRVTTNLNAAANKKLLVSACNSLGWQIVQMKIILSELLCPASGTGL